MSANSFVNGFMGGMNAMNGMLDSKARREEAAWRKEMYLEDREIAAQDRAYQLEERGRIENVRNLSAVLHQYQGLDAAGKKSAGKAFVSAFNDIPGMSQYTDNSNPDERREVDDFRFTKNANGETWVVPVAGIYDVKTNKKIRAGDYTQNGENGGAPIGVPMKDFYDFLSSQQGSGAIRSMQAEVIRQGGTPTEAKEQWSDIQEKDGQFYQTNLTTNENKTVGYRRNGKGKGKNSGTGSDGSGYGGSDWTSVKNGTVEVPSATDPSVMVTVNRRLMHQEGTNNYVYEDDDGKGNIKYTEVKGKLPSGLESMFGVEAATTDPNAAPVVTAPNAPPVAGAEAVVTPEETPVKEPPKQNQQAVRGLSNTPKNTGYGVNFSKQERKVLSDKVAKRKQEIDEQTRLAALENLGPVNVQPYNMPASSRQRIGREEPVMETASKPPRLAKGVRAWPDEVIKPMTYDFPADFGKVKPPPINNAKDPYDPYAPTAPVEKVVAAVEVGGKLDQNESEEIDQYLYGSAQQKKRIKAIAAKAKRIGKTKGEKGVREYLAQVQKDDPALFKEMVGVIAMKEGMANV